MHVHTGTHTHSWGSGTGQRTPAHQHALTACSFCPPARQFAGPWYSQASSASCQLSSGEEEGRAARPLLRGRGGGRGRCLCVGGLAGPPPQAGLAQDKQGPTLRPTASALVADGAGLSGTWWPTSLHMTLSGTCTLHQAFGDQGPTLRGPRHPPCLQPRAVVRSPAKRRPCRQGQAPHSPHPTPAPRPPQPHTCAGGHPLGGVGEGWPPRLASLAFLPWERASSLASPAQCVPPR